MWSVLIPFYSFLNPVFSCSKSFISFSLDKVTIGTYNFVFVISNFNSVGATIAGLASAFTVVSAKTQFFDLVKINSTSQLNNGMFKVFQKLLKCFSGITTSVSFSPTLFASYPSSSSWTL